ncbi:MAG: hypothetical protein IAX21_05465 [Candidatus Bathyarchaeota archaeon]|nr:hypothetical protein [Candidatus Bathyarchaeum tardum]WGM89605.1 MAG: hypothetical protein NUK63_00320 [Candidatus Bathyarchaeum tardum]WNZ30292.1 MAG: hypothetical protein IAX21_05465 [Candidatus Bathyarchaeota archaeon]
MPKDSKNQVVNLSKNSKVQRLISKFVSGEIKTLKPIFDEKYCFTYPIVDEIIGEANTEMFLEELTKGGILKQKLHDKIIECPSCKSSKVATHYTCPYCKSINIKKSALIEHIKCGYIDIEDKFQNEDKLVCPKCGTDLIRPDLDYNKAGVWCNCNSCNKSFDIPVPDHFCRECETNFNFDDSTIKDVYAYTLTPQAAKEANVESILTTPITALLQEFGYNVESPGYLTGKSGTKHKFDITATDENKNCVTAMDLAFADDVVSEQSVISMFAKIFDTVPDNSCLVAVPQMSENGKNLAKLYNIELIEAKDQTKALEALRRLCLIK